MDKFGIKRNYPRKPAQLEGTVVDSRRTYHKHPFYSTQRWKKISLNIRGQEPFCRLCSQPTESVDHLDGSVDHNYRCNLQGLCGSCHGWKSNEFEKRFSLAQIADANDWDTFRTFHRPYWGVVLADPSQYGTVHVIKQNCWAQWLTKQLAVSSGPGALKSWMWAQAELRSEQLNPVALLQYTILRLAYQTTFQP